VAKQPAGKTNCTCKQSSAGYSQRKSRTGKRKMRRSCCNLTRSNQAHNLGQLAATCNSLCCTCPSLANSPLPNKGPVGCKSSSAKRGSWHSSAPARKKLRLPVKANTSPAWAVFQLLLCTRWAKTRLNNALRPAESNRERKFL